MTYHILNGDALVERFKATGLTGELVVVRECLIDGDLQGDTLTAFYQTRATYIEKTYQEHEREYYRRVASEFQKLQKAPENSEFNLWFGYDLFCRANMWFVLSLLQSLSILKQVFVVHPTHLKEQDIWKDFGGATPKDLMHCFDNRLPLNEADLRLGSDLWAAYKSGDFATLENLSKQTSAAFPYLEEVCKAHIERLPKDGEKGRPERVLEKIIQHTSSDFYTVFTEFSKREGIYGFGDSQVKQLYDKVVSNPK